MMNMMVDYPTMQMYYMVFASERTKIAIHADNMN
jgi:hypothetical protein